MGLLDNMLGSSIDDPKTAAVAQMVQGLLSSPNAMRGLSGGLLGYQDVMQQARRQKAIEQMQALQLQQHQMAIDQATRAAALQTKQDRFRDSIPSPQMQAAAGAMQNGLGPTIANAAQMKPVAPMDQFMHGAMQSGEITPMQYLQAQQKDDAPIKLGAGEQLLSGRASGYKPLANNPKEQVLPAEIQGYNLAKMQGYTGSFEQWDTSRKKAAGTNVSVNMDQGFGQAFATDAAKSLAASRDQARSAASNIQTLDRINGIMDGGKVAVGPTAKFETFGRQLGEVAGIGGKDNAEKLGNTRKLIQGAATLAADGAKLLAGQGQITEGERALIMRASGGDIDGMTAPEIRALTGVLRKVNAVKIQQHQSQLKNVGPKFEAFKPFYNVDMPQSARDIGDLLKQYGGGQ
jgi:hypothetical protein